MSIFVSILGLGFLILIHEAGHFFVARGVGMNPRKFYLGFPPAIVKTKRNGIEYGVGAIPLGGYVKIPGMHRPAAGDLDSTSAVPSRSSRLSAARWSCCAQRLDESDYAGARDAVTSLAEAIAGGPAVAAARQVGRARAQRHRRCARAGRLLAREDLEARRGDLRRARARTSSWPSSSSRRCSWPVAARRTRTVDEVVVDDARGSDRPAERGTRSSRSTGSRSRRTRSLAHPSAPDGRPLVVTVERDGGTVRLGPTRPEKPEAATASASCSPVKDWGRSTRPGRPSVSPGSSRRRSAPRRPPRHGRRAEGDLEPGRHRAGLLPGCRRRATTRISGCLG